MTTLERGVVPFLPESVLAEHKVLERGDGRYRSAARMRQALLREERGWPIGYHVSDRSRQREVGSYLGGDDNSLNFITPEIAVLARRELAYREDDALIEIRRLFFNMLSSHPATFNIFGALALNLRFASAFARRLFPDVQRVTSVIFEHSPGRRDEAFIADRSAFDVLFRYIAKNGSRGFIAWEVKLTETLTEPPARLRARYDEVSLTSGCFQNPDDPALRGEPFQQLWRQLMLATTMLDNGLYEVGHFAVVAPFHNTPAQHGISSFARQLVESPPVAFRNITLETVVETIRKAGARDIAALLHERYLDFSSVDALIV